MNVNQGDGQGASGKKLLSEQPVADERTSAAQKTEDRSEPATGTWAKIAAASKAAEEPTKQSIET